MKHIYTKQSISEELAQELINAATSKAREIGRPMTITILDESGRLKAFRRMDGAALVGIEISQIKAYTAVGNMANAPTHEIGKHVKDNIALLISLSQMPNYTTVGGGFPIKINNQVIGSIGVSGGTADQDMAVAETALAILSHE